MAVQVEECGCGGGARVEVVEEAAAEDGCRGSDPALREAEEAETGGDERAAGVG